MAGMKSAILPKWDARWSSDTQETAEEPNKGSHWKGTKKSSNIFHFPWINLQASSSEIVWSLDQYHILGLHSDTLQPEESCVSSFWCLQANDRLLFKMAEYPSGVALRIDLS